MDYKDTLNLPKTPFPMKGNLPVKEKEILKFWEEIKVYEKLTKETKYSNTFILHDGPLMLMETFTLVQRSIKY